MEKSAHFDRHYSRDHFLECWPSVPFIRRSKDLGADRKSLITQFLRGDDGSAFRSRLAERTQRRVKPQEIVSIVAELLWGIHKPASRPVSPSNVPYPFLKSNDPQTIIRMFSAWLPIVSGLINARAAREGKTQVKLNLWKGSSRLMHIAGELAWLGEHLHDVLTGKARFRKTKTTRTGQPGRPSEDRLRNCEVHLIRLFKHRTGKQHLELIADMLSFLYPRAMEISPEAIKQRQARLRKSEVGRWDGWQQSIHSASRPSSK